MGGYILGGLLQGLGSGLSMEAAQRRENALIALRRQYQQEDANIAYTRLQETENRAETRAIANDQRDAVVKTGLLELAQQYKQKEGETNQAYEERLIRLRAEEDRKTKGVEHGYSVSLENLKHKHNLTETQVAEAAKLESDLKKAGQTVDHWEVTTDGKLVGLSSTGTVIAKSHNSGSFIPSRGGGNDDDETPSISDARGDKGKPEAKPTAAAPAPKADPNANDRAQALARLGNVYHHATPEEYPGLFRNGKKISMEEAKALIRQRYP